VAASAFHCLKLRRITGLTDQELLAQLRNGNEDAFDVIFRTYYARLVHFGEAMLGERAPAEELAQDVMLELWKRRTSLTVDTSLQGYLFRATRNRTLNYIRHEKVVKRGSAFAAQEMTTDAVADSQIRQDQIDAALHAAVSTLPPRCREVFELSRSQGLKYSEIAATLGISIKTVEAQMGKALKIVRELMSSYLPSSDI
jgi:RNA polymerase sigma-70 factor (ECF subfamily)